jgi:hypothetical protein
MDKFFEFISIGIMTPVFYVIYSIFAIIFTFALGLPVAIGIYLIQMFINWIFHGGVFYANL